MMYQLRDLRVRHLDRQDEMLETWTMETLRPNDKRKPWRPVPCYLPTLELELRELAERSAKRTPGTYKLPIEANDAARALVSLFDEFQAIEEVDK